MRAQQLSLFEIIGDSNGQVDNGKSVFSDPAFAKNKIQSIHRWVPWIAGFSSDFVKDALNKYLTGEGKVLDPFAGVGTTLVETILSGHNAIGFEINPYAALASQVKVNSHKIDTEILKQYIARYKDFYNEKINSDYSPVSHPPEGFKTRSVFYSPKVLKKVLILHDFINTIDEVNIENLFRLAFASTMVSYSNYSYEPSLGRRVSAGKSEILDYPVGEVILNKLSEFSEDIKWFQKHKPEKETFAKIIEASFFEYEDS